MSAVPMHALTIAGTGTVLPMDILGSGGRIRKDSGEDVGPSEIMDGESCVLDMRSMEKSSEGWFEGTISKVLDRTGLDVRTEVIPLSPTIVATTGGIPVDARGRAVFVYG